MLSLRPYDLEPGSVFSRHHHTRPYATVVLEGAYWEAGDAGRIAARPGSVLLHGHFSAHRDEIDNCRTVVLDLPLPIAPADPPPLAVVEDIDEIVRLAAVDGMLAANVLLDVARPAAEQSPDLPDLLASTLSSPDPPRIADWADAKGYSREHVSREFRAAFGVAPARFRAEASVRRAWRKIVATSESLSSIAVETGFADQAHMGRWVKRHTGRTPGEWRRSAGHRLAAS